MVIIAFVAIGLMLLAGMLSCALLIAEALMETHYTEELDLGPTMPRRDPLPMAARGAL